MRNDRKPTYSYDNGKFLSTFFKKWAGSRGGSPLWDFKGQRPLTPRNSKQNLRTQILTI